MRIERSGDVAILRMEAGKANAINAAFLDGLEKLLQGAAEAGAAVLTGQGGAFCAGLDLPSLMDLDLATMRGFMRRFDEVMMRVFSFTQPLIAAVNGHAVAGGCVLALQADVRIAAD